MEKESNETNIFGMSMNPNEGKAPKKGLHISPLMATSVLVVIALAAVIVAIVWIGGFSQESILKMNVSIKDRCSDTQFTAQLGDDGRTVTILNQGSVPIYGFSVTMNGDKKFLRDPTGAIASTQSGSIDLGQDTGGAKVNIVPVLLGIGASSGSEKAYVCDKSVQVQ